jgi:hypothetical protein
LNFGGAGVASGVLVLRDDDCFFCSGNSHDDLLVGLTIAKRFGWDAFRSLMKRAF